MFGNFSYANMEDSLFQFALFATYCFMITVVIMNLIIAVLSDSYELVSSENKFYEGIKKLEKSLMYERMKRIILKPFKGEKEQTYHYLFVSKPICYDQEVNL